MIDHIKLFILSSLMLAPCACTTTAPQRSSLIEQETTQTNTPPLTREDSLGGSGEWANEIAAFREFLSEFRRENKVLSFSVAVLKDGEIIMMETIGWQDHDAEEPTQPETAYLVASITKTFTAATLLAMDADGHIDLDADFTSLSDWDERCAWLTRAGIIFGGGVMDDGRKIEAPNCDSPISLRHVLQNRVQGTPGTSFFYNPIVFGRLSNWVEEHTDRSWREWMPR